MSGFNGCLFALYDALQLSFIDTNAKLSRVLMFQGMVRPTFITSISASSNFNS